MHCYIHRYTTEFDWTLIEKFDEDERIIAKDQHDYLAWLAGSGVPIIEADGRFLSVIDNQLVIDPNMEAILAAEQAAREAEAARIAAKLAAINDNLPTWDQVQIAVQNIGSLADAKAFLLKLSRVVYWLAKDKAD